MKRRSAIALIVVVLLLLATALALRWAMRPQTLGPHMLALAGRELGLEISAGKFDYRLRGAPQLVARAVSARVPGAEAPLLEAERVFISVPWSTLRARGTDLTVSRIELDAPRLRLQPFLQWWSQRPPGDGRLPTLVEGLLIERGHVDAEGWSLHGLTVDVPHFASDARVRGAVRGSWQAASFEVPFAVRVSMTRPLIGSGLGIAGTATLRADGWQLGNHFALSTRPDAAPSGAPGFKLQRLRLSSASRYESPVTTQRFALGLAAEGAFADGAISLAPAALALRGQGLVPDLDGLGHLVWSDALVVDLAGDIRQWPAAWPALPPPVGDVDGPLPFRLHHAGPPGLSEPVQLEIARGEAHFEGSVRVPEIPAWLEAIDSGTPLPPLQGRLRTPRINVGDASLHGVEVIFEDEPAGGSRSP